MRCGAGAGAVPQRRRSRPLAGVGADQRTRPGSRLTATARAGRFPRRGEPLRWPRRRTRRVACPASRACHALSDGGSANRWLRGRPPVGPYLAKSSAAAAVSDPRSANTQRSYRSRAAARSCQAAAFEPANDSTVGTVRDDASASLYRCSSRRRSTGHGAYPRPSRSCTLIEMPSGNSSTAGCVSLVGENVGRQETRPWLRSRPDSMLLTTRAEMSRSRDHDAPARRRRRIVRPHVGAGRPARTLRSGSQSWSPVKGSGTAGCSANRASPRTHPRTRRCPRSFRGCTSAARRRRRGRSAPTRGGSGRAARG